MSQFSVFILIFLDNTFYFAYILNKIPKKFTKFFFVSIIDQFDNKNLLFFLASLVGGRLEILIFGQFHMVSVIKSSRLIYY